jgi:hypothetical protein
MTRPTAGRASLPVRLLAAATMLALGCGGAIGSLQEDGARNAGPDLDAAIPTEGLAPLAGNSCARPSLSRPPAHATCDANVRVCFADTSGAGSSCPDRAFTASVRQQLGPCAAACGPFVVGVSAGCVTEVLPGDAAPDAGLDGQAIACIRKILVGTGWACAPGDGWVRVPSGACLTP